MLGKTSIPVLLAILSFGTSGWAKTVGILFDDSVVINRNGEDEKNGFFDIQLRKNGAPKEDNSKTGQRVFEVRTRKENQYNPGKPAMHATCHLEGTLDASALSFKFSTIAQGQFLSLDQCGCRGGGKGNGVTVICKNDGETKDRRIHCADPGKPKCD